MFVTEEEEEVPLVSRAASAMRRIVDKSIRDIPKERQLNPGTANVMENRLIELEQISFSNLNSKTSSKTRRLTQVF